MSPPIRLRSLTPQDFPFADEVRAGAGWNQTLADWRRFLELEPGGCFVAEWEGAPAGTATTIVYGPELAWIGMVLVHPQYRRQGVGGALLEHCIEYLRDRGVRCIKLDATPQGQPVYQRLGFQSEWTLARWERPGRPAHGSAVGQTCLSASRGDFPVATAPAGLGSPENRQARKPALRDCSWPEECDIHRLDATAFGVARRRLWNALEQQGSVARCAEASDGTLAGCGLSRPGSRARYLGPVVATSPEPGLAVIDSLLAENPEDAVFWDIPDPNTAAGAWAESHGFRRQRTLTRMWLGENERPGNPRLQFALAGPEVG